MHSAALAPAIDTRALRVAVFSTPADGHMRRLLPIVRALGQAGARVRVYGSAGARAPIEAAGAECVDLYGQYPIDLAAEQSIPNACKYVTFAGCYAGQVIADVRPFAPDLVIHDSFAVIARVVAATLGVPAVNVCSGHNLQPARIVEQVQRDLPVHIPDACRAAADRLRSEFGLADASPFSYVDGRSRWLNVYCEPEPFLSPPDRAAFEPIAFFGSLPEEPDAAPRRRNPAAPHVYASFGTVIWRYFAREALATLAAIADAVAARPAARLTISFGGTSLPDAATAALRRANVEVQPRVDQWRLLAGVDVFITHHGLNSTHEAIHHEVPMLSYPFFWDQPGLAQRCRELGLAEPLVPGLRAPVTAADVNLALDAVLDRRSHHAARLAEARGWEREAMAGRAEVVRRIVALA
jgi:UDP:flavonoid glycosyltransferase YjiC (YdhE family)